MWIGYQKNQMDQVDQIVDQQEQIGICTNNKLCKSDIK